MVVLCSFANSKMTFPGTSVLKSEHTLAFYLLCTAQLVSIVVSPLLSRHTIRITKRMHHEITTVRSVPYTLHVRIAIQRNRTISDVLFVVGIVTVSQIVMMLMIQ